MHTIARIATIGFSLGASFAARIQAQAPSPTADDKEVAAYRLTTESWTKIQKAMRSVIDLAKRDPKVQAQLTKDDDTEDPDGLSVSELAKQVSELKPFADALRQAGMTPREYAVWTMAFLEAATVVTLKQSGVQSPVSKQVSPANVKFVEDHMAQMAAMQQEFDRVTKKDP